jgi:hypothetical protein
VRVRAVWSPTFVTKAGGIAGPVGVSGPASDSIGVPGGRIRGHGHPFMPGCGVDVLILPCTDLGGRRVAFEVFEVPVEFAARPASFAYQRHRGVVCLQGPVPGPGPGAAAAALRSGCQGATAPCRHRLALTPVTEVVTGDAAAIAAAREGIW